MARLRHSPKIKSLTCYNQPVKVEYTKIGKVLKSLLNKMVCLSKK